MEWDSYSFYQLNQNEAWLDLSHALRERLLTLMVGAGISSKLGLPEWPELAKGVAETASDRLGLIRADRFNVADLDNNVSGRTLLRRMLKVRRQMGHETAFVELVKQVLYGPKWETPSIMDASPTLRALGMMIAGSQRGRINEIVNFNFDSLLEWYLLAHGFVVASYRSWPSSYIEADVRIYHPHGYLPFSPDQGHQSSRIAFDEKRVNDIVVDPANQWKHLYRYLFCTRIFLAVGLSGEDPIINLMLQEASALTEPIASKTRGKHESESTIEEAEADQPPIGFWCQRKPKAGTPEEAVWPDWKVSLNSRRIVLLEYSEHDELGVRLEQVVRDAAGAIRQGA